MMPVPNQPASAGTEISKGKGKGVGEGICVSVAVGAGVSVGGMGEGVDVGGMGVDVGETGVDATAQPLERLTTNTDATLMDTSDLRTTFSPLILLIQ